jgi:hypothetical protein
MIPFFILVYVIALVLWGLSEIKAQEKARV